MPGDGTIEETVTLQTATEAAVVAEASLSVATGEYQATLALSGTDGPDGTTEVVQIYPGKTTLLEYTYTSGKQTVTDLDLARLKPAIPAPAAGQPITPHAVESENGQYTGLVTWYKVPDGEEREEVWGTEFGSDTVYAAELTLTAEDGWTFTGVGENAFRYAEATAVTNAANTSIVTIVFPKTGTQTATGGAAISLVVNDTIKLVDEASGTETSALALSISSTPTSARVTAPLGYSNPRWYVGARQVLAPLSNSDRTVTIAAETWGKGAHTLTFIGTATVETSASTSSTKTYSARIPLYITEETPSVITYKVTQAGGYLKFEFSSAVEGLTKADVNIAPSRVSAADEPVDAGSAWYLPITFASATDSGDVNVVIVKDGVEVAYKTVQILADGPQSLVARLNAANGNDGLAEPEDASGVARVFGALHTYLTAHAEAGDIRVGDYIALPALTVDDAAYGSQRLLVVGRNTFRNGGSYEYADSSTAPAHLVFQFQDVVTTSAIAASASNSGGYAASTMHTYLTGDFLTGLEGAGIPRSSFFSPTRVMANDAAGTGTETIITAAVWLPTEWEVFGASDNADAAETGVNQPALDYYRDAASRTKTGGTWWLASPVSGSGSDFCTVSADGEGATAAADSETVGIAPAFCVQ